MKLCQTKEFGMHTISGRGFRRANALAISAKAMQTHDISVSRAELSKDAKRAAEALELRPALRLVLNELVGVWGEKEISGRLMVWPSNAFLGDRTGLSERAIRYALSELGRLQLISIRDSANGKRFAIRNEAGEFVDAYGFDLSPLHSRRSEFDAILEGRDKRRRHIRRMAGHITTCKRQIAAIIETLTDEHPDIERSDISARLSELAGELPRRFADVPEAAVIDAWNALLETAEQRLKESANGGNSCRLIETDKGAESGFDNAPEEVVGLALVQESCPALLDWGGRADDWESLVASARYLRPSIGASEDAWREAVERIGEQRAAIALALVLQLSAIDKTIRNPGGYFRAMCRMISEGRINLDLELRRMKNKKGG
jgi:replication initiation protein RepC